MSHNEIVFKLNTSEASDIFTHLSKCSEKFIPRLETAVSIADYSKKLASHSERFEAWCNNELVGLVAIYLNDQFGQTGFITNVSVDPMFQKKGIANRLIASCMKEATKRNYKQIELEVNVSNFNALKLYQQSGFKTLSSNESNLKMVMNLNEEQ